MAKSTKLPGKTVERLSEYRRTLLGCLADNKNYIYSHELASMLHITAVQVRRDLMLIGHSSVLKKGYDVRELIGIIGTIVDSEQGVNVAIVGMGNLGRAITGYLKGKRSKLNIIASFDVDPEKVNKVISGVKCYDVAIMGDVVKDLNIGIVILTVPPDIAKDITETVVRHGVKGILNFTTVPVNVPAGVHLEAYDMITSIEKVAYFVKNNTK
jgi:redox-sensing transcriptional repressor